MLHFRNTRITIKLKDGESMEFKELVSTRRLQLKLTMEELGNKVGVSKATVQRWESGEITNVRRDKIAKLAQALEVTPAYLMGWEDTKNDLSISDRLNKYINEEDIEALSKATKLSERRIRSWLSGEKEPNMGQVRKLADYWGVNISDIIGEGYKEPKGVSIPVLGKVIAGVPIEAIEDIIDYEEIDAEMAKSGEFFALQISGDSMEPKFSAGDVVIVRKQSTIESGQIAIVRVNGYDATVKKVLINDGGITLVPFNSSYDPIYYSKKQIQELPVEIAGRVVELRAKF